MISQIKKVFKYKFFLPTLVGVIFIILCSLNIQQSIWFDESYSAMLNRFDFAKIWEFTAADVHPPLYYFALKVWSTLFGSTDIAMRMMSVFFGALSVLLVFLLVSRNFSHRIAVFATALTALCPILIRYGQEMRMYTMTVFIVLLATLLLEIALKNNRRRNWLLYGFAVALGLWTHYFTVFAWFAHAIYVLTSYICPIIHKLPKTKTFAQKTFIFFKNQLVINIISALLLAFILFLPWTPMLFAQFTKVQGGFWIEPVSLLTLPVFVWESLFYNAPANFITMTLLIILTIGLIRGYSSLTVKFSLSSAQKQSLKLIALVAFLPPALLFIISMPPLRPLFMERYLLYSSVMIWLVLAIFIATLIKPAFAKPQSNLFSRATIRSVVIFTTLIALVCFGFTSVQNRTPNSQVKKALQIALTNKSPLEDNKNQPILVADNLIFYQAIFYHSSSCPIYTIQDWRDITYTPMEPLDHLPENTYQNLTDFLNKYNNFVFMSNKSNPTAKARIEAIEKDFRPVNEVFYDTYIITEYVKK